MVIHRHFNSQHGSCMIKLACHMSFQMIFHRPLNDIEEVIICESQIRLQLETLLAEKARLAHENSVFSRENRFLREVVEYHQLTMQDIVYLDEGIEEITEVCPVPAVSRRPSVSPTQLRSPTPEKSSSRSSSVSNKSSHGPLQLQAVADIVENEDPPDSTSPVSSPETAKE